MHKGLTHFLALCGCICGKGDLYTGPEFNHEQLITTLIIQAKPKL